MPSVAELLHLRSWRQLLKALCHDGVITESPVKMDVSEMHSCPKCGM